MQNGSFWTFVPSVVTANVSTLTTDSVSPVTGHWSMMRRVIMHYIYIYIFFLGGGGLYRRGSHSVPCNLAGLWTAASENMWYLHSSLCFTDRSLSVANGRVNLGGFNRACVMGVAFVIKVVRF
jgi:hypothetical protein